MNFKSWNKAFFEEFHYLTKIWGLPQSLTQMKTTRSLGKRTKRCSNDLGSKSGGNNEIPPKEVDTHRKIYRRPKS